MFRVIRKMRRDERGQALVIGAIAMLICAVMVMASVSIGHGVYSKIKLQDAADAQSYTMAVKQARAYNFFAYTNRAMVVHYNAMMTFMSYVSHAYYLDTTIGNLAEVLSYVPYIGPIFKAIEKIIEAWLKGCEIVSKFMIPILTAMNVALWAAQEAMLVATILDHITTSESEPVKNTDPKAKAGYAMGGGGGSVTSIISNGGLSALNIQNFLHPIDDALGVGNTGDPMGISTRVKLLQDNKLSDHNMAKYRLMMGNIANSARREWTAIGKGPILLGRKWKINLCAVLGGIKIDKWADTQIKNFDENAQDNPKDQIYAADSITVKVEAPCIGPFRKTIFKFDFHMQVAADNAGGWHRLAINGPFGYKTDKNEHKFIGITPFILSDPSYINPWTFHFGYPCNTVVLTKDMIGTKRVFEIKSKFMEGQGSGNIEKAGVLNMSWDNVGGDSSIAGAFRGRTGGMMAMAVGRAIYHRPGDWMEEPNFFNPLWTARLAPMRTHYQWGEIRVLAPEAGVVDAAFAGNAVNY